MGAHNPIRFLQMSAHTNRDRLLPDAQMNRTTHFPFCVPIGYAPLDRADPQHFQE
jgi:hypothetical protein